MSSSSKNRPTISLEQKERVLMVGMQLSGETTHEVENSLAELNRLIDTLGAQVVFSLIETSRATTSHKSVTLRVAVKSSVDQFLNIRNGGHSFWVVLMKSPRH